MSSLSFTYHCWSNLLFIVPLFILHTQHNTADSIKVVSHASPIVLKHKDSSNRHSYVLLWTHHGQIYGFYTWLSLLYLCYWLTLAYTGTLLLINVVSCMFSINIYSCRNILYSNSILLLLLCHIYTITRWLGFRSLKCRPRASAALENHWCSLYTGPKAPPIEWSLLYSSQGQPNFSICGPHSDKL